MKEDERALTGILIVLGVLAVTISAVTVDVYKRQPLDLAAAEFLKVPMDLPSTVDDAEEAVAAARCGTKNSPAFRFPTYLIVHTDVNPSSKCCVLCKRRLLGHTGPNDV